MAISPSGKFSEIFRTTGQDGPVSLHWLICKIPIRQTEQYLGNWFENETPETGLKLVALVLLFSKKRISKDINI